MAKPKPEPRKDVDDCGVSLETVARASCMDLLIAKATRLEEENRALRLEVSLLRKASGLLTT